MVTAAAVIAHEIPQKFGDVAVLLDVGSNRSMVMVFNLYVSLTIVADGVLVWVWLEQVRWRVPNVITVAAARFLVCRCCGVDSGSVSQSGRHGERVPGAVYCCWCDRYFCQPLLHAQLIGHTASGRRELDLHIDGPWIPTQ
ncbi:MAG: hypothetical protein AAF465_16225 [Pseudomonadota bacterium]